MLRAASRLTLASLASLGILVPEALAAEPPPMTAEQVQLAVHKTITTSAPAIDQCTEAYVREFPAAMGQVVLKCVVMKDGSISKAEAVTDLEGARNLRPCLEAVAKGWKLPPVANDSEKLSLTVGVKKGLKFTLPKPGEKVAEKKESGPQGDSGFVQFLPRVAEGAK